MRFLLWCLIVDEHRYRIPRVLFTRVYYRRAKRTDTCGPEAA